MALIFEDRTRILRRCLFDVHNEVGVGYPEEAYHRTFVACCRKRGIPISSKQGGQLHHRGKLAHTFQYDVLAWDEILLELKSLPGGFAQENYFQIISYLKFWEKSLGLLVSFGQEKVKVERVPFAEKPFVISEDYEYIQPLLTKEIRPLLLAVRAGILEVGRRNGLGYGKAVYGREFYFKFDPKVEKILDKYIDTGKLRYYMPDTLETIHLDYTNFEAPPLSAIFYAIYYKKYFKSIIIDTRTMIHMMMDGILTSAIYNRKKKN